MDTERKLYWKLFWRGPGGGVFQWMSMSSSSRVLPHECSPSTCEAEAKELKFEGRLCYTARCLSLKDSWRLIADKWQTLCFSATTITTTKPLTGLVIAELLLLLAWGNAREASHRLSLLCVSFWESLHISGLESRLSSAVILGQPLASVPARPTGRKGRSKDFMKEEHLLRTASGCPRQGQTPSYVFTSVPVEPGTHKEVILWQSTDWTELTVLPSPNLGPECYLGGPLLYTDIEPNWVDMVASSLETPATGNHRKDDKDKGNFHSIFFQLIL